MARPATAVGPESFRTHRRRPARPACAGTRTVTRPSGEGDGKKGQARKHVAPADPAALPPGMEQEDAGEHDDAALAQHREREEKKGKKIGWSALAPARWFGRRRLQARWGQRAPPFVVGQVGQHRAEQEGEGQRVLQLGNPGDRFHRERMDDEEQGGQPCEPGRAGNDAQPDQQAPEQKCAQEVQPHVQQVIARRGIAPEMPGDPLHGGLHGEIIQPAREEPGRPPPGRIAQHGIAGDLEPVVPDPVAVRCRQVDPPGRAARG